MAFWSLATYTRPDISKEFYIRKSEAEVLATPLGVKITEYIPDDIDEDIDVRVRFNESDRYIQTLQT